MQYPVTVAWDGRNFAAVQEVTSTVRSPVPFAEVKDGILLLGGEPVPLGSLITMYSPFLLRVSTPASMALAQAFAASKQSRQAAGQAEPYVCQCEFVDVGVGPHMKVAENPECPECTEFGYAVWAYSFGMPAEKAAAKAYLFEVLGPEPEEERRAHESGGA
jgi:hypothetical protein